MRKNIKWFFILILFSLSLVNRLFSQTTDPENTNNPAAEEYSYPTYSSETINSYAVEDKRLLPFVYNGFIYIYSLNRKLPLWRFFIGGDLENPFISDHNRLFFFDIYNRLYSVNLLNGKIIWVRGINNEIIGKPCSFRGSIVIATQNGSIMAFSRENGELIKKYDTEHEIVGGIIFYDNIIIITFKEGTIKAYNINTDEEIWKFTNTGFISVEPMISEGRLFFGTWDDNFYVLDVKNGKLLWITYVGSEVSRKFLIFNNDIILFLSDGEILSLDKRSGIIDWVKYFKGMNFDYNYFKGIEKFFILIPGLISYNPIEGNILFTYRERVYKLYKDMLFDSMVEGKHFIDENEREKILRNRYFVLNSYPILPPIRSGNLVYFVGEDVNLYIYNIKKDFFILKYNLD